MRSLAPSIYPAALMLFVAMPPCLAQQPADPDKAIVRPTHGVQHPDLGMAWTDYDERIRAAKSDIANAINEELTAATDAGNLEAALRWENASKQFQRDGSVPDGLRGRKRADIGEAKRLLKMAYQTVEEDLVKLRKIEDAKLVRAEKRMLFPDRPPPDPPVYVEIEARNYTHASPNENARAGVAMRQAAKWDNLTIPADSTLQWEVELPKKGEYYVHVLYASDEPRPCDVTVNGKPVAGAALASDTGGFMKRDLRWGTIGPTVFLEKNTLAIDPHKYGPHMSRIVISQRDEP